MKYILRAHTTPWLLPLLVLGSVFNVADRGAPWRGEWLWTVDWVGTALVFLGPLLAGATAWDVARATTPERREHVESTPRAGQAARIPVLVAVVTGLAAHAVGVGVAVVVTGRLGPEGGAPVGALLVQVVAVVFWCALGYAVATLAPSRVAPLVAVLAGVVLVYWFGLRDVRFAPLRTGGATSSLLGFAYDPGYLALQTAVLGAAVATLLWTSRTGRAVGAGRWAGAGAALAILVAATAVGPADRLVDARTAPGIVCRDGAPIVCTFHDHRRFLNDASRVYTALYSALSAQGMDGLLPTRVRERLPQEGQATAPAGAFVLPVDAFSTGTVPRELLIQDLVTPLHCPQLFADTPPDPAYDMTLFALIDWLLAASGPDPPLVPGETVRNRPVAEQRAFVVAAKRTLDQCDFDSLPAP